MTPPLRGNAPRSLLGILQRPTQETPGAPPLAETITTATIEAVTAGGRYIVRGVVTPTAGPARLVPGQQVQVAWKDGRPSVILAVQARRAQFGELAPDDRLLVAGVVEELFVATVEGVTDIWFRNREQVTKLNLRAQLPADPEYVRWGARGEAFVVRTPTQRYHVFRLNRTVGVPVGAAPLVASLVRTETPLTSEIPLFTIKLAYTQVANNRYLHLRYANALVESALITTDSTALSPADMKGGTARVRITNLGSGAGATLTACVVQVKPGQSEAPTFEDAGTFPGLAAGETRTVVLPVPVPWIAVVASAASSTSLRVSVAAVTPTPFTLPGSASAAATRLITLRTVFGTDLFNGNLRITDVQLDDRLHLIVTLSLNVGNAYRLSGPVPGTTIASQRQRVTGVASSAPLNVAFTLPCPADGSSVINEPMTSTIASQMSSTLGFGNHTFVIDVTAREVLWKSCLDTVTLTNQRTDDVLWAALTQETQTRSGVETDLTCQGKLLRSGGLLLNVPPLDFVFSDSDRYLIFGSTTETPLMQVNVVTEVAVTGEVTTVLDTARCPFLPPRTIAGVATDEVVERVWIARIATAGGTTVEHVVVKYRYTLRRLTPDVTTPEAHPNVVGGGSFSVAGVYAPRRLRRNDQGVLTGAPKGMLYLQAARRSVIDRQDLGLFAVDLDLDGTSASTRAQTLQALAPSLMTGDFSVGYPVLTVLSQTLARALWRWRRSEAVDTEIDRVTLTRLGTEEVGAVFQTFNRGGGSTVQGVPLISKVAITVTNPRYPEIAGPVPVSKQPMLDWLAMGLVLLPGDFLYWTAGEAFALGWDSVNGDPSLGSVRPPELDSALSGLGVLLALPEGVVPRAARNELNGAWPDQQFAFVPHLIPGPSYQVV